LSVTAPASIAPTQVQLQVEASESAAQAQVATRQQAVSMDSSDRGRRLVQKAVGLEALTDEDEVKTTVFVRRTRGQTGKGTVPDDIPSSLVSIAQPTGSAGKDLSTVLSVQAPLPQLAITVSQRSAGQDPGHDHGKIRATMTRLIHRFPEHSPQRSSPELRCKAGLEML